MRPHTRRLLASAALLAAAAVLTAVLAAADGEVSVLASATNPISPARPAAASRVLAPASTFAALTQRPLFLPSRQPEPERPRARVAPAPPAPPAPPALSATLVGVLMSPAGRSAILRLADGKTTTVREGGTLDGWTLKQVSPDRVSLLSGATTIEIAFPVHGVHATPGSTPVQPVLAVRRRR